MQNAIDVTGRYAYASYKNLFKGQTYLALLATFNRCYKPVGLCVPQELIAKEKHLALRCLQNTIVVQGLCVPQDLIAKEKHLALRCLQNTIVAVSYTHLRAHETA